MSMTPEMHRKTKRLVESLGGCDVSSSPNKLLLSCPFCGGVVAEVQPSWNIANAKCTSCGEEWGHCGAEFKGRYDKWNIRAI